MRGKAATVSFYKEKLRRLLADRELCGARLDAIDKAVIDGYKQRRARHAPAMAGRFRPRL